MSASLPYWTESIRCSAKTDVGLRRANNQDSHAVVLADTTRNWFEKGHLIVVADGMGAHAAGEVAAKTATDTIVMSYVKRVVKEAPPIALQQSVYDAHQKIREQSNLDDAFRDMGTTVDALILLPQGAVIAHVGDSRVYRWRKQRIEQLTFDHSLVWEICEAFRIPFDQAPPDIPRNQITRSLGPTDNLKVDLEGPFPIMVGDVFLSCSDGLSGQVSDQEMGQILEVMSPEEATETLVNLANLRGGPDNITLIIAQAAPPKEDAQNIRKIPQQAAFALGAALIMLIVMFTSFILGYMAVAFLGGLGTLLSLGTYFWLAKDYFFGPSWFQMPDEVYGEGPYTSYACPPCAEFAEKLASILQQFRQVTQGDKWHIQWDKADVLEQAAQSACETKNYGTAIRDYSRAINYLMSELKKQQIKK